MSYGTFQEIFLENVDAHIFYFKRPPGHLTSRGVRVGRLEDPPPPHLPRKDRVDAVHGIVSN